MYLPISITPSVWTTGILLNQGASLVALYPSTLSTFRLGTSVPEETCIGASVVVSEINLLVVVKSLVNNPLPPTCNLYEVSILPILTPSLFGTYVCDNVSSRITS